MKKNEFVLTTSIWNENTTQLTKRKITCNYFVQIEEIHCRYAGLQNHKDKLSTNIEIDSLKGQIISLKKSLLFKKWKKMF